MKDMKGVKGVNGLKGATRGCSHQTSTENHLKNDNDLMGVLKEHRKRFGIEKGLKAV